MVWPTLRSRTAKEQNRTGSPFPSWERVKLIRFGTQVDCDKNLKT